MNLANMSSADRLKAAILIGLTVVALAVVGHTILGAVSPKTKAKTDTKTSATKTASTGTAMASASGASVSTGVPGLDFPVTQAKHQAASRVADAPELGQDLHDPFIPMDPSERKQPVVPTAKAPAPAVRRAPPAPEIQVNPLPSAGFGGSAPVMQTAGNAAPMIVPPPPEPEIRLMGIIEGEPSVATVQVDGRTVLVRPGDAVAKGYRLAEVGTEGVLLKTRSRILRLRVGGAINEAAKKITVR